MHNIPITSQEKEIFVARHAGIRSLTIKDPHIRHLLTRLIMGDQPVKTTASAMGFASSASFCFAFRRATGMSPSE
jgi:AraC-like DNA-binding protein